MITQTNPFPQGGTSGPMTTYAYDLLGRNTLVTYRAATQFAATIAAAR